MTTVCIMGAAGRMGQMLIRCGVSNPNVTITGAVERPGHPDLGKDAGVLAGIDPIGVLLTDDPAPAIQACDAVIDFSFHEVVPDHAELVAKHRRALVIGTTALSEDEAAVIDRVASLVPVVWAPNMSLGVNLLFAMTRRAAEVLGDDYDVTIDDTHHVHKKDAPSGTALWLGSKVAEGKGVSLEKTMIHDEGGTQESYPEGSIPIRSYRRGEVVGDHTVRVQSAWETIELTHHAWSRDAFARGALHAARWVVSQRPRLYDMQDVLGLQ